jgi:D-alanine-D-alanine ligase-like ATP-grasp enzyme
MVRKGLGHLSNVESGSCLVSPSLGIMKDCANEMGITVEDFVDGTCEFKSGGVTRLIGTPLDNGSANWLCSNKYATFEILKKYGFQQVPRYQRYSLGTINEARQDFLTRNGAVVIKPSRQTFGGTGVTVNIRSMKHLNKAIFNSLVYDSNFLMEDFIEGDNFRVLLFKDRMLNAVKRVPANIKGDGTNSIKRLIDRENERRTNDRSLFRLNPIVIDNDVKQTLLNNGMSLNHVPARDEVVFVRTICNHHAGGETMDVTSNVHPDIVRDCQKMMKIMDVTLGGIDLITTDIGKPLAETGGAINEVNTSPALDIHDRAVSMNLLRFLFEKGQDAG